MPVLLMFLLHFKEPHDQILARLRVLGLRLFLDLADLLRDEAADLRRMQAKRSREHELVFMRDQARLEKLVAIESRSSPVNCE